VTSFDDILDAARAACDVGAFHVARQIFETNGMKCCVVCFTPLRGVPTGSPAAWLLKFRGHEIPICGGCTQTARQDILRTERVSFAGDQISSIRDYAGQFHFEDDQ
jgi:hypothetical protein